MTRATDRALSPAEMQTFGEELDAIRDRVIGSLGASDTRYIRRVAAAVRWSGVLGRSLLFLGAFSPLFWAPLLWPACIAGTLLLALTSLVVFGLCLATVRGLRNGSLLAPEPVAQIVPNAA